MATRHEAHQQRTEPLTERDLSLHAVGDYWLTKRRDGRSPYWQIASYKKGSRSVVYRSTATECLDEAIEKIEHHFAVERGLVRKAPTEARVVDLLMTYWRERGSQAINNDQTARSIRTFIGFIAQDVVSVEAVVTDLTPVLFERFREWRMGEHWFQVPWGEDNEPYESPGVSGATVQRNINDVRAAMNHAYDNMRISQVPKIRDIDRRYKSKHKDRILTPDELARILWYSYHFPRMFRFVVLQMLTSVRPMAAAAFTPTTQFDPRSNLIDLQPDEAPQTKKRNAIIPAVRPVRPVLQAWIEEGGKPVGGTRTSWRKMRKVLGLSDDVEAKTIRYTVATWLYEMDWVPERQIAEMLGHAGGLDLARTSRIYAKYRPDRMGKVVKGLELIWLDTARRAKIFAADHLLTTQVGKKGEGYRVVGKENIPNQ